MHLAKAPSKRKSQEVALKPHTRVGPDVNRSTDGSSTSRRRIVGKQRRPESLRDNHQPDVEMPQLRVTLCPRLAAKFAAKFALRKRGSIDDNTPDASRSNISSLSNAN